MSDPPKVLVYAELLSNIRQVSLGCSLPSICSASTRASISLDGTKFWVYHDGKEGIVDLPGRVQAPKDIPINSSGTVFLNWRLPLAHSDTVTAPIPIEAQPTPWSAQGLLPGASVCCRTCRATILDSGVVRNWKDLPSENWAEMMEFWHCHKPHEHGHLDDVNLASKGYGANSRFSGQPNTGLVDLSSFLFLARDCSNLTKPNLEKTACLRHTSHDSQAIHCGLCDTELGVRHEDTTSVSLFKWQLDFASSGGPADVLRRPTLANCVSSILMATLARSGCSKSIIIPLNPSTSLTPSPQLLHIWLFNSNIVFTSTECSQAGVSAVKVLYKFISPDEAQKLAESMSADVQEITLPHHAIAKLGELLSESSTYLPERDRTFKEWTVGLLAKWKGNEE